MNVNGILSDLFLRIAKKLGFELQSKQIIVNDFKTVTDISITAVLSDRLATLIAADSDITITGDRTAEDVLNEIANKFFNTKLKVSIVTSCGTGDCLIVPVTDGIDFGFDIIENNNFYIDNSIGDNMRNVIIKRDEFVRDNNVYARYEAHMLMQDENGTTVCRIYRYAYKNDKEIDLNSIDKWSDIPTETIIPNVDRLLFGRIKCPTVNRENINSVQGVPITYGLDVAVTEAKDSYKRFNEEYRRKQTKIFARKDMFVKEENKGYVLPSGSVYQFTGGGDMDKDNLPLKEFSPDLRYDGLKGGVDFNFKMLEMFCGLSTGVLSEVESTFATATEIRASMNMTFAFINVMRKLIDSAMDDLMYAVAMLYNANSKRGALGKFTVGIEWDDSMKENSTETFNMMLQAKGVGELEDGEIMSWLKNIPLDKAKEIMEKMEQIDTDPDMV